MNEGANQESAADRAARSLRVNRADHLEDMIQRLTELGDTEGRGQLEAVIREWEQSEWSDRGPSPVDALARHLSAEVMAVMTGLTDNHERLASLRVVTLNQEEVSARLRPLPDGSALVYLSDATVSLCAMYSGYAAEAFARLSSGGRLRSRWRVFKAYRKAGMGKDPTLLEGLLRYYLVNQRVFGLSAKLVHGLTADFEPMGEVLTAQAASFVLGHEIAHHVLDHRPAPSGFSPADDLSACSDSERMEFEADLLGYQAAVRVGERAIAGAPAVPELASFPETVGALGALIGMLAIHVTEQGLFIRRGRSHPPAPARAARLLDQFAPQIREFAQLFLGDLLWATREASDFSETGKPFDLQWFEQTRQVTSPQPMNYVGTISILDALQCRSRQDLAGMLATVDQVSPIPLAEATRAALAGDARVALLGWGVPPSRVDKLCNPLTALLFSTLVNDIRASFEAHGVPEEAHLAAVAAAQLLAQPLGQTRSSV